MARSRRRSVELNALLLLLCCCWWWSPARAAEETTHSGEEKEQKDARSRIVSIENGAICENRFTAFFVVDNGQLQSKNAISYKDISEEECSRMCADNKDSKGRSILCASFTYDHLTFQCSIYRTKSQPDGEIELGQAPGKRYFEKFCLAEYITEKCREAQFMRVDQSVLVGYALNVSIQRSLEGCMDACLREMTFVCKSAMYFYNEGECITNSESALSKPDAFAREETDKVIYIQNGCVQQIEQQLQAVAAQDSALSNRTADGEIVPPKKKKLYDTTAITEDQFSSSAPEATTTTQTSTTTTSASSTSTTTIRPRHHKKKKHRKSSTTTPTPTTTTTTAATTTTVATTPAPPPPTTTISEVDGSESDEDDEESAESDQPAGVTEPAQNAAETTTRPPLAFTHPKALAAQIKEPQKPPTLTELDDDTTDSSAAVDEKTGKADHELKSYEPLSKSLNVKPLPPPPSAAPTPSSPPASPVVERPQPPIAWAPRMPPSDGGGQPPPPPIAMPRATKPAISKEKIAALAKELQAPELGLFSDWSPWTRCARIGERKVRRRKCLDLTKCRGALMQVDWCLDKVDVDKDGPKSDRPDKQPPNVPFIKNMPTSQMVISDPPAPPTPPTTTPFTLSTQRILVTKPPATTVVFESALPPSVMPMQSPKKKLERLPDGAPGTQGDVWSPWLGVCEEFASKQPCSSERMIGFESRECIAKDPAACKGPFFRYCTIPC